MSFLPFYPGMIFDLDGTLLDSMEVWNQVDQEFLAQFGHSVPSDLMEKIKVMNLPECAVYFQNRFSIPLSSDEIMDCWKRMGEEAYAYHIQEKPMVKEFLLSRKEKGAALCIATSCHRKMAQSALNRLGLSELFDFLLTSEEVGCGKSSPEIFLQCVRRLCLSPEQCLVVEDSLEAGVAAQKAGFPILAVYEPVYAAQWPDFSRLAQYAVREFRQLL